MLEVPNTLRFGNLLKGLTHKSQNTVVIMIVFFNTEGRRIPSIISKEKRYVEQSLQENRHKFPGVPFDGVAPDTINCISNDV